MSTPVIVVDAFTTRAFAGNPAAVCVLGEPAADTWMQRVAGEMNLAETAFLYPEQDGYRLRWFTPTVEVDLCGHATLASAHVLWSEGHWPPGTVARFYTRSGCLSAMPEGDRITLDFPATVAEAAEAPGGLLPALGIAACRWLGRSRFDFLVELEDEAEVRALRPDYGALARLPARGVIVTARARHGAAFDFVSRFFAPGAGVPEDPVTGSAHCALGP